MIWPKLKYFLVFWLTVLLIIIICSLATYWNDISSAVAGSIGAIAVPVIILVGIIIAILSIL